MTRPSKMSDADAKQVWDEHARRAEMARRYCVGKVVTTSAFATVRQCDFDARGLFADCDVEDVVGLIESGWDGVAAKQLAVRCIDANPKMKAVVSAVGDRRKKPDRWPFRCSVDSISCLVWLRKHRPELFADLGRLKPELRIA